MDNDSTQLSDRLLKARDILNILQLSRSAFYAAIRAGTFPKPIKLGKASRWRESTVVNWMKGLPG